MKLQIGEKTFSVKIADTPEARKDGLLRVKPGSMPDTAGLVLKYDTPTVIDITMVGMKFPIQIVFVKDDLVQKVVKGSPEQSGISINTESDFVVEVVDGAANDIKSGDNVTFVGEKLKDGTIKMADGGVVAEDGMMQVLDENGKVQTNIFGGERVFSRIHTRTIVELAEKASKSDSEVD